MATSLRAFQVELFEEHLEEASFLYDQCLAHRRSKGASWSGLAEFEHRLALHLDALLIGAELALEVCQMRAAKGDPGEQFAAASVFCRQGQAAMLSALLSGLDPADSTMLAAVGDALKYELPQHWVAFVDQALRRSDRRLLVPLSVACAYRRIPCEDALLEALARESDPPAAVLKALGHLRSQRAGARLVDLIHASKCQETRAAALSSLAWIGKQDALRANYLLAQKESWPRLILGLGSDAQVLHVLAQPLASGHVDKDSLLALGLLGMPASLRYLYECLAEPGLADAAASAMNMICGADLFEQVFVPEPLDEAELFPKELRLLRETGQPPVGADGKPFGANLRKLTTDQERWKPWFTQFGSRFDSSLRYRWGQLYCPQALLRGLAVDELDSQLRTWSYEELCIRYGCDLPFDVDMPVMSQRVALQQIQTWVQTHEAMFKPGEWYFAGAPQ